MGRSRLSWGQLGFNLPKQKEIPIEGKASKKPSPEIQGDQGRTNELKAHDDRWPNQLTHWPEIGLGVEHEFQRKRAVEVPDTQIGLWDRLQEMVTTAMNKGPDKS